MKNVHDVVWLRGLIIFLQLGDNDRGETRRAVKRTTHGFLIHTRGSVDNLKYITLQMKCIAAPCRNLSVPRDRSNPKFVVVEEDIIVDGATSTPRRVREIFEVVKCFKIILVFDHHTRNAATTRTLGRRRILVKGFWCRIDINLQMVGWWGFAFLAIDLPKAVYQKWGQRQHGVSKLYPPIEHGCVLPCSPLDGSIREEKARRRQ